jgi:hypothetical protein
MIAAADRVWRADFLMSKRLHLPDKIWKSSPEEGVASLHFVSMVVP